MNRYCKAIDLVSKALGCDDGDLITNTLVGLEVKGEFWVVAFDDDLCGLFDGLKHVSK